MSTKPQAASAGDVERLKKAHPARAAEIDKGCVLHGPVVVQAEDKGGGRSVVVARYQKFRVGALDVAPDAILTLAVE